MTCTPDKTVLADGTPPVNIKTEATQFYERGMIDMKKKMAIVLSLVLACSMSMTAFAAPSPSLNTGNTPAEQIVVDSSVTGTTAQAGVGNVTGPNSAVASGTTFATVKGNRTVDASAVLLVVEPTVDTASASHLASALNTKKVKVINQSGEKNISILNNEGKVKYLCTKKIYLTTTNGELVASKGSISVMRSLKEIVGSYKLAENETIRAMYKRADGSYAVLPVVIKGDAVSFALPSISGPVEVVFTAASGVRQETLQTAKAPKL
ncbi:MAG TPA: hypothetical protein DER20_02710 [Lachnospiraceae bacterium]|nr:hypothetical protein [Lachnospiraceae bacterium]